MSQARPGYRLRHHVPPMPCARSRITKSSMPACRNRTAVQMPPGPAPMMATRWACVSISTVLPEGLDRNVSRNDRADSDRCPMNKDSCPKRGAAADDAIEVLASLGLSVHQTRWRGEVQMMSESDPERLSRLERRPGPPRGRRAGATQAAAQPQQTGGSRLVIHHRPPFSDNPRPWGVWADDGSVPRRAWKPLTRHPSVPGPTTG
jgi:hypothetical protein